MNRFGVLMFWSDRSLAAIHHAFTSTTDSESRWQVLAAKGADDDDLRLFIGRELGISGGCSGNDRMCRVSYRGGAHPAIWLHTSTPSGTPTLTGKELLRVARAMFGIGQPVMEDQMRLL